MAVLLSFIAGFNSAVAASAPASQCSSYTDFNKIGSADYSPAISDSGNQFLLPQTSFAAGDKLDLQIDFASGRTTATISDMSLTLFDGNTGAQIAGPLSSINNEGGIDIGTSIFSTITLAVATPNNIKVLAKPTYATAATATVSTSVSLKCTESAPPPPPVTVTLEQAASQVDPTTTPSVVFDVVFSEAVTGFATGDVTLSGTAGATTATVSGSGTTYTVTVTGMTTSGTVIANIPAGVAQNGSAVLNEASTSADNTVNYTVPPPPPPVTVTLEQAASQVDPTTTPSVVFDVVFSEAVTGFATGDVTLSGTAGATTATVSGSGTTYTVTVTGMTTSGTVIANIPAGVAQNGSAVLNEASTSADNTVNYTVPPPPPPVTVTLEQAASQVDPTTTPSVVFDVVFSEAVTGFATGDLTLSGTAGATTATVSGSNANYTVTVTGMTTSGTVIANIPAGVAQNGSAVLNEASISADNTVNYTVPPPPPPVTVTLEQAASQVDPTTTPSVVFDVVFSEAVTGFTAGDVTLTAPAGATVAVVGSGANYTVTVTGMTAAGNITASIPAAAAQSAATSASSAASTSADNTVTYSIAPPTSVYSDQMDDVQDAATGVAAHMASEAITESVAEEIGAALSGQVQVVSASEGKVGLVYTPGMGKGSMITPTADVASGKSDFADWRIWASLRYTDFDSSDLEGDQVNALIGASFLFGDGLVAGLVAGYEDQDYEDDLNATLQGEGFNVGGYVGGALDNGLRFDAQVHASFLDYDMEAGPVTGSTEGTRLIIGGGLAHTLQFGATTIEPTARFSGTWEWQDGYTDSAAVLHDDRDFNFGRLSAGAKIMHHFDLGDGASISPFVTGFADYRFSGGDFSNETLLDGVSARAGLGINLRTGSGISASALAEFSGLGLDDNVTTKSFKAQLAIPF